MQDILIHDRIALSYKLEAMNAILEKNGFDNVLFKTGIHSLRNTDIVIGLVGIIKTGKSALLNSILGKEIVPTGILPKTAALIDITSDENMKNDIDVMVNFMSKQKFDYFEGLADGKVVEEKSLDILEVDRKALKREISSIKNERKYMDLLDKEPERVEFSEVKKYTTGDACFFIDKVRIFYNGCKLLKKDYFNRIFVDTPGLNDTSIMRSLQTHFTYKNLDIAIFVLSIASGVVTSTDMQYLREMLLCGVMSRTFIVINNMIKDLDKVKDEIEDVKQDAIEVVKKCLDDINNDLMQDDAYKVYSNYYSESVKKVKERIFIINPLKALNSKRENDISEQEICSLLMFEKKLESYCMQEFHKDYIESISYLVKKHFSYMFFQLKEKQGKLKISIPQFKNKIIDQERTINVLTKQLKSIKTSRLEFIAKGLVINAIHRCMKDKEALISKANSYINSNLTFLRDMFSLNKMSGLENILKERYLEWAQSEERTLRGLQSQILDFMVEKSSLLKDNYSINLININDYNKCVSIAVPYVYLSRADHSILFGECQKPYYTKQNVKDCINESEKSIREESQRLSEKMISDFNNGCDMLIQKYNEILTTNKVCCEQIKQILTEEQVKDNELDNTIEEMFKEIYRIWYTDMIVMGSVCDIMNMSQGWIEKKNKVSKLTELLEL